VRLALFDERPHAFFRVVRLERQCRQVRLDAQTLPAVSGMASSIDSAARSATTTLRRVGDTPQSLLFGPPPTVPGPGEPGFAGFGR